MTISIPNLSLVVLIGPSGSGKSTFARKHFLPTEVLSSDACRGIVSDDENNQAVTNEAFALLHYITSQRLALGRLTVIDATNVQPEARKPLVELARKYHCLPVAVVLKSGPWPAAKRGVATSSPCESICCSTCGRLVTKSLLVPATRCSRSGANAFVGSAAVIMTFIASSSVCHATSPLQYGMSMWSPPTGAPVCARV